MDFLEMAMERYSVRRFDQKQIEKETMDRILKAGQIAPTAMNLHPQKIYVIQSEEMVKAVREHTMFVQNAPTIVLICTDLDQVWQNEFEEGHDSRELDGAVVGVHMMLEAWEQGVGSTWVRGFNGDKVKEILGLPENVFPVSMLPMGYPAENSRPYRKMHGVYKDIEEIVEYL